MSVGDRGRLEVGAGSGRVDVSALGNLGQLDDLGEMIRQAAAQGNVDVQVSRQPANVVNLQGQGEELRSAILGTGPAARTASASWSGFRSCARRAS